MSETKITADEKVLIKSMLPTTNNHLLHNSDENVLKHFMAVKSLYLALKTFKKETPMGPCINASPRNNWC